MANKIKFKGKALKVEIKADDFGLTKKKLDKASKIALKEIGKDVIDLVIDKVTSGTSPVRGYGRYEPYSDGYAKKKGRKAPVDLLVTGKMLQSLRFKFINPRTIEFFAKDKKFPWHNEGRGSLPKRKVLPNKSGEEFKSDIQNKLNSVWQKIGQIIADLANK